MLVVAGILAARVDLLERKSGADAVGQPRTDWTEIAKGIAAEVKYISGAENRQGERTVSTTTHTVRMRYRTVVTAKHRLRVRHSGELLEVESAGDEHGDRSVLLCQCHSAA